MSRSSVTSKDSKQEISFTPIPTKSLSERENPVGKFSENVLLSNVSVPDLHAATGKLSALNGFSMLVREPDETDLALKLLRDEMNEKDVILSPWLSSAVKSGELTEESIRNFVIASGNEGNYATINLSEISAFDLNYIERHKADPDGCSCFGLLNSDVNNKQGNTQQSGIYFDISLINPLVNASEKNNGKSGVIVYTSTKNNDRMNPSWKTRDHDLVKKKKGNHSLVSFTVTYTQIIFHVLRIRFLNAVDEEIVGFLDVPLKRMFETSYAASDQQETYNLEVTDEAKKYLEAKLLHRLQSENSIEKHTNEISAGRCRISYGVTSCQYIIDLLHGPDPETIFVGLSLTLRLIQGTELQHLYLEESSDVNEARPTEDILYLMAPKNFQYLFSCINIIENGTKASSITYILRKKAACLLVLIFMTGLQKFGKIFAAVFEPFGSELSQFIDSSKYEEEIVMAFLEFIEMLPLSSKLEAATSNDCEMIGYLINLCNYDRMEDIQFKSLAVMNSIILCIDISSRWKTVLLRKILESGLLDYILELLESWHPQLAEESVLMLSEIIQVEKISIRENTLVSLRRIEIEHRNGKQGILAQKILFNYDFQLQFLEMRVLKHGLEFRNLFMFDSTKSVKAGQYKVARSSKGRYQNVDLIFSIHSPDNNPIFITHLIGISPISRSDHAVQAASCFAMDSDLFSNHMKDSVHYSFQKAAESTDVSILKPCAVLDFKNSGYAEVALSTPVAAKYLLVRLNPGESYKSKDHLEICALSAVGYFHNDLIEQKRRDHKDLLASITSYL